MASRPDDGGRKARLWAEGRLLALFITLAVPVETLDDKMEKEMQERVTKEDAEIMDRVYNRELDPISASEKIFEEIQDSAEGYDPGRRELRPSTSRACAS